MSWYNWIPVVSTISNFFSNPAGIHSSEYTAPNMPKSPCCDADDELACMNDIDSQLRKFIANYVGLSTGADAMKTMIGGVGGYYLEKMAAVQGGRFLLGASITGGILAVDGVIDFAITFNNLLKMKDAATEAKGVFCICK